MGIQVEFNPDLALRSITQFGEGTREKTECVPETLEEGKTFEFLKQGQRNYYLLEPLLETQGEGKLSRPLASITILEATHFLKARKVWTKGKYKVERVFDPTDPTIHFEGMQPL